MRPIDSTSPLDPTIPVTQDSKPAVTPSPGTVVDQVIETADPDSVAAKKIEQDLDASYFRGELGRAHHRPDAGVLYDSKEPIPGGSTAETKRATTTLTSSLVGKSLGANQSRQDVQVKRDIASPKGYDDKLQAVAAARMAGAEPAAVFQDPKTLKWHAVETSVPADGLANVTALPSFAKIVSLKDDIAKIKTELAKPEIGKDRKEELQKNLANDRQQMASLLFAVPSSQVQFNATDSHDDPAKINIDPINPRQSKDVLGNEHFEGNKPFEPGLHPAFAIKTEELDTPQEAASVLFHEVSHKKDDELALQWVDKYQKDKHTFVEDGVGEPYFRQWMDKQVLKGQVKTGQRRSG